MGTCHCERNGLDVEREGTLLCFFMPSDVALMHIWVNLPIRCLNGARVGAVIARCVQCGVEISFGSPNLTVCPACSQPDAPATSVADHGAQWEAEDSEAGAPGQVEQQRRGRSELPIGALVTIVAGVACLILATAGRQVIEAWGPGGFLIVLFAEPLGWILLTVGIVSLIVQSLRAQP